MEPTYALSVQLGKTDGALFKELRRLNGFSTSDMFRRLIRAQALKQRLKYDPSGIGVATAPPGAREDPDLGILHSEDYQDRIRIIEAREAAPAHKKARR